ncbi:MAG: PAS domain S-box protein [Desulfobacteraceae bacterium]|nr:MAG: PAS domain S-box protein [Desulfobacteraceae bacterium]
MGKQTKSAAVVEAPHRRASGECARVLLQFSMIRALTFILVCAGILFQFPLSTVIAKTNTDIIIAGVHRNFPPIYTIDETTGKPAGFAIDIMDEVANRSGFKIQYVIFDEWPSIIKALKNGQIDIIPNMGIIEERFNDMDFTSPVETFNISLFVREATSDIKSIYDLEGRKVAVVKDNKGVFIIKEYGKANPFIFNSLDEALLSLLSGNTDALVYPEPPLLLIAIKSKLSNRVKKVGKPLFEVKRAIAVGKGNKDIINKLDAVVKDFITTQEYKKIYTMWYGAPYPYWTIRRLLILAGIILVFIIIIFTVWRYLSLKRLNIELKYFLEEQIKTDEILKESEKRLRDIIDHAQAGYFLIDRAGCFQNVNNAWLRMHGYESPDEVIGCHFSLTQVDPDMETAQRNIEMLLDGGNIAAGEFSRRCRDGTVGYHTFSMHPVIRAGKIVGLEGFIIDITARKLAEKEKEIMETRNRQLQKAESLGRMAGAIAHNFNNQLGVVIGNLDLAIKKLSVVSGPDKTLTEAMKSAIKAAEISGLMLTYLGQTHGKKEPIDLSERCRLGLRMIRNILPEDVVLKTDFPFQGPIVKANSNQIQQILINLFTNAWESIEDGQGYISITVKTVSPVDISGSNRFPIVWQAQDTEYACLEVADTGCGIAEKDIEKLFDPFYSTKFTGRGLGLPVVLGVLNEHHGCVTIWSEPGKGSVFRIFLPVV